MKHENELWSKEIVKKQSQGDEDKGDSIGKFNGSKLIIILIDKFEKIFLSWVIVERTHSIYLLPFYLKDKEKSRSFIYWFILLVPTIARAEPGSGQEPTPPRGAPIEVAEFQALESSFAPSKRGHGQKYGAGSKAQSPASGRGCWHPEQHFNYSVKCPFQESCITFDSWVSICTSYPLNITNIYKRSYNSKFTYYRKF